MSNEQLARRVEICHTIAADMKQDAADFDGKPFTGRTVAEYLGGQGAAIAALANMLAETMAEARRGLAEKGGEYDD